MIDLNSGTGFLLFYNIAEARLIKRSGGWVAGWRLGGGWVAGWRLGGWVVGWLGGWLRGWVAGWLGGGWVVGWLGG